MGFNSGFKGLIGCIDKPSSPIATTR